MIPLTFQHRAGVSPYTSSFDLAETCVFAKQLLGPILCGLLLKRLPLSLTYGVNLPSSLTTILPMVLGFSPHLPVSVCGTGTFTLDSGFSCQCGISYFGTIFPPHQTFETSGGFSYQTIYFPWTSSSSCSLNLSSCVPTSLNQMTVVLEFQPVVHRLRLSASA